jgi:D-alanine-D-alanine ligase
MCHEALVPPDDRDAVEGEDLLHIKTEHDVLHTLRDAGHDVHAIGLLDELAPLREAIDQFKPHVVFNLLEEFREQVLFDAHVVSYLELIGAAYTGCNPRGLVLARDKALAKKILTYHRIHVPRFWVFPRRKRVTRPKHLEYPVIVKSLWKEASEGISQASVVHNDAALIERVQFIHESIRTDAIAEQYIDGRELYVGVIGNQRLQVLPAWELFLDQLPPDAPRIATRRVKWDPKYQAKHQILAGPAEDLPAPLVERIRRTARRICRRLYLDGYVRIDFRLAPDGRFYFLEANPNPDIAHEAEFAEAAQESGLPYRALLERVVRLGVRRHRLGG